MSDIINEEFFPNIKNTGKKWSTGTTKRGLGARQLLETEIREAQEKSHSAFETARTLGVSYNTYKKYAKLYGIFDVTYNPKGTGVKKPYNLHKGKYALDDILNGKYPNYSVGKLKRRLINSGYLEEECTCCGFNEKRVTDGKSPLLLDFIDNNWTNHSLDNLRLLCYNCFFLLVGKRKIPKDGIYVEAEIVDEDDIIDDEND